jgi:hypothetical protein
VFYAQWDEPEIDGAAKRQRSLGTSDSENIEHEYSQSNSFGWLPQSL